MNPQGEGKKIFFYGSEVLLSMACEVHNVQQRSVYVEQPVVGFLACFTLHIYYIQVKVIAGCAWSTCPALGAPGSVWLVALASLL